MDYAEPCGQPGTMQTARLLSKPHQPKIPLTGPHPLAHGHRHLSPTPHCFSLSITITFFSYFSVLSPISLLLPPPFFHIPSSLSILFQFSRISMTYHEALLSHGLHDVHALRIFYLHLASSSPVQGERKKRKSVITYSSCMTIRLCMVTILSSE